MTRWAAPRPRRGPIETALAHPRHLLLAALVGGLLAGPRSPPFLLGLAAASLVVASVLRRDAWVLGLALVVTMLLGAVVARERLRALDATSLRPADSFTVRGFAVEPARSRASGVRVVPVRIANGERVLVRAREMAAVGVGEEVVARGELRALRPFESFERRRGVHAVLEAERVVLTGERRASVLDDVRRRAERALGAGLPTEQSALARGMVLGQDDALPDDLRDAFRASGLAHLVRYSATAVNNPAHDPASSTGGRAKGVVTPGPLFPSGTKGSASCRGPRRRTGR